ncbi:MAG: hypothetical protein EB059_02075 [Alphaproteobacteria bacterium]|nr:hypothetical protein [Alphaproteobacteria bacterium]
MKEKKRNSKIKWIDPDDVPELTAEWFRSADLYDGDRLIRRGRPAGTAKKKSTTVRFDEDVLLHFRKMGKGWQTKMNEALREWLYGHAR